jgi:hypothetical protein
MNTDEIKMTFNRDGKFHEPLRIFVPDDKTIVGVYQGSLSAFDILIKYRQKNEDGKWSNIRTPKHIHWAVDLLIKMHSRPAKIKDFLDFLIEIWNKTVPIENKAEREKILNIETLLNSHKDKLIKYKEISNLGEYRIEFLILLAKLLMIQEKTNMKDAYMFRELLEALKSGKDIFKIVSIATHNRR